MRFVVDLCAEVASCSYLRQPEICGERALVKGMGKWQGVVEGGAQASGNTFEVEIRLRFRKCGRRLLNNLKHKTCRQRQRQPHDKMPTIKCNSFFKPWGREGKGTRQLNHSHVHFCPCVCECVYVWVAFYDNANLSEEDVDTFFSRWQRASPRHASPCNC